MPGVEGSPSIWLQIVKLVTNAIGGIAIAAGASGAFIYNKYKKKDDEEVTLLEVRLNRKQPQGEQQPQGEVQHQLQTILAAPATTEIELIKNPPSSGYDVFVTDQSTSTPHIAPVSSSTTSNRSYLSGILTTVSSTISSITPWHKDPETERQKAQQEVEQLERKIFTIDNTVGDEDL